MTDSEQTRCGYVAVIGAPNAGKSTLVNHLVGAKVSIVTHKVQTTRTRVLGIAMRGATQLVLVDTPGIFAPKRRLDRAMVRAAWDGAKDADAIVLLVDAQGGVTPEVDRIIQGLSDGKRRAILALNKVDTVKADTLLGLSARLNASFPFERTFMISALNGSGVEDLAKILAGEMPWSPWLFPEDEASDMPVRLLAAEVTREKLFLNVHEEVPYALTVETELWEEKPDGSARVEQTIYVERDSQKAIILGKGGQRIKAIGAAARHDLEAMLEKRIHLFLFVKVREGWQNDRERYRTWNLDFD